MSINVGVVGIGFMGWIHWLAWQQVEGARVVAICERDEAKREGDWTSVQGNFGPPGEQVDLSAINVHESYESFLSDDRIDLIDICLPPAMHVDAISAAAKAGKQVLCEKPLSLRLEACDRAVNACARNGVQLFVGHVLPFFVEFQFACKLVRSEEYGRLIGGNFKRIISDPIWLSHFYDRDKIGGPLFDLHVHDAHLIRMLFGMPVSVFSSGRTRDGVAEYFNSIYGFADPEITVACSSGVINQQGRPFCHGFEIHLEKATICFEFAAHADTAESINLKVICADGSVIRPADLGDPDPVFAFVRELQEVIDSLNQRRESEILAGTLARDAIAVCEAEEESISSGEIIRI